MSRLTIEKVFEIIDSELEKRKEHTFLLWDFPNDVKKRIEELDNKESNLEQDLGCPLEVVFKALNGFYTEFGYVSNEDDFIYLRKDSDGWYLKVVIHPSKPKPKDFAWFETRRLKDYGKTWFLKGDMENEKD